MSLRARLYFALVLGAAIVAALISLSEFPQPETDWPTLILLSALSSLSYFAQIAGAGREASLTNLVFLFAGLLLLPPPLFVLLVIFPHAVEWIEERIARLAIPTETHKQVFNIAAHILAGLLARQVMLAIHPGFDFVQPVAMLAVLTAAILYVGVKRLLNAGAVLLESNGTLRDSNLLDAESLFTDFILMLMGYTFAVLWRVAPWMVVLLLLPLALIYRALSVPQLRRAALTDAKTGLWNAQQTVKLLHSELARAVRTKRSLAVIMADLDLLRNINNTYGHLAGDIVLSGVGKLIRDNIRQYDSAGRFGGEEFLIVLPEATLAEARVTADRLRSAVDAASFTVSTSRKVIHVTMSLGIAGYPAHATQSNALIHQADLAVYYAKLIGRNVVIEAGEVPESFNLSGSPPAERVPEDIVDPLRPRPD